MQEDDDDPVVQEIPVYLSKLLAEKLFLYQFPVRPRDASYDDSKIIQSCIKPQHQEVKLEVGLDMQSSNYDKSRGEQIAWNVDGAGSKDEKKKSEEKFFKNDVMDKQILQSTRALPDTSKYAVAVYHDNELHITPLRGIVHLRPSFVYLDKSDKRAKEEAKEHGEADLSGEEEEAQQVTVKFAQQETERKRRARERSFGYLSQKSAEEPWFHTEFHNSCSEKAELERGKLYCTKVDERVNELSLGVKEYMKNLVPVEEMEQADVSSDFVSHSSLTQMPAVDKVRTLLREAKLLPFSQLATLLEMNADTASLLRIVQQVAVLVQGNWVVRSDVLYPKDTSSNISGVPAELMCRGRDYILYLFTQNRYVDRRSMSSLIRLPSDEIKEILEQISTLRVKKGWELRLPFDKEFVSRYPDVVQRQQMWWDAKHKQLLEALREGSTGKSRRKSNRDSSVSDNELSGDSRPSPKRNQRRRTNHKESFSSDNESGAESGLGMKQPQNNCAVKAKASRRTKKQDIPKAAIQVEAMET
jgi:DNA-directed RNA polymerase-3 subunit RPC5